MTWAGGEHTHSGEPSDARKQRAPNEPAKQTRRSINADLDAVPWGLPWSHCRGGNCLFVAAKPRSSFGGASPAWARVQPLASVAWFDHGRRSALVAPCRTPSIARRLGSVEWNESRGLVGPVFAHESVAFSAFSRPTMVLGAFGTGRTNSAASTIGRYCNTSGTSAVQCAYSLEYGLEYVPRYVHVYVRTYTSE